MVELRHRNKHTHKKMCFFFIFISSQLAPHRIFSQCASLLSTLSLFLFLSLSLPLSLSLSLFLSLFLSISHPLSLALSLFLSLSFYLSLSIYLSRSLCQIFSLSVFATHIIIHAATRRTLSLPIFKLPSLWS